MKALLLAAALCVVPLAEAHAGLPGEKTGKDPGCTVVEPTRKLTLEVVIPHSADFCPLLARALGEDVLDTAVGMTENLWHYAGAKLSCGLYMPAFPKRRITIYNSRKACHWLELSGWARTRFSSV